METVDVIVIGGGVIGASIAFHLSSRGIKDVLIVERNSLASAASSQAAGLIMQVTGKPSITPLVQRTIGAFSDLQAILDENIPFRQVGCVKVGASCQTIADNQKNALAANKADITYETWDQNKLNQNVPWLETKATEGGIFFPSDGYIDPYLLATAYARAAKLNGVKIKQGTSVVDILYEQDRVCGVRTSSGDIKCKWVVDAAGAWANSIAEKVGIALPMVPVRSHYWMSKADPIFPDDHPMVILPDAAAYSRPEVGGLLFGIQEKQSRTFDARDLPDDIHGFAVSSETEQWDALIEAHESIQTFFPDFEETEWTHYIAGLSSYTPDGKPLIGAINGVEGFLVASGCCGYGIAQSGGIGAIISDLIETAEEQLDITEFRVDRFGEVTPHSDDFRARCAEARSRKSRS
jgi:4-methylaminobutanoate oxidase (formaldehyde-forming)